MSKKIKSARSFLSRYFLNEKAAVLPLMALTFPVVLGMIGLGTDASMWMAQKRQMQNAADAAVLAAGWELANESDQYMDIAAFREAEHNGYDVAADGELTLDVVDTSSAGTTLGVTLEEDANSWFSRILYRNPMRISVYAEALVGGVTGGFCILALEDEDSGAFQAMGSVTVNAPECGIAVNSISDDAITMSGNADVEVSTVTITGGYDEHGSVNFVYTSMKTGQSAIADPYADLVVPATGGCNFNNTRVNSARTLSPGTYCGGLDISGTNNITFQPGVYIIKDSNFKVTGGGNLIGEGVTFILTGSGNRYAQLDISGSRTVEFSAPEAGEPWAGITLFQDRHAPQNNNLQNKLVGTSNIYFNGVAYFPSQGFWFGGNTQVIAGEAPCTRLIARTVTLAGNPALGNNCAGYDLDDIGTPSVRLVN